MKRFLYVPVLALLLLTACGSAPTATPENTVPPPPPSNTPEPTSTPLPTATNTPIPTDTLVPTITPTPGPIVVDDDFSADNGRFKCDFCTVRDGVLLMGPYPSALTYDAYYAICSDCGLATNYKMSVDTWYIEGPSDRGFGLLLRENDGFFIDLELLTWQVYGVWTYNPILAAIPSTSDDAWGAITDGWVQGWVKAGRAVNHVEVIMKTENNKTTLTVIMNDKGGRTMDVNSGSGNVGLLVGMHSIGVAFDNFRFEELR